MAVRAERTKIIYVIFLFFFGNGDHMVYFYEIFAELAVNFLKIKSADSAFIPKFIQYSSS